MEKEIINEKNFFKFIIQDTGIGMDNTDLQKLFTPFFSNNTTETNRNGCGLGLLIVKEITEKLGSGLKVSSELGKGTLVVFYVENKSDHLKDTMIKDTMMKYSLIKETVLKDSIINITETDVQYKKSKLSKLLNYRKQILTLMKILRN